MPNQTSAPDKSAPVAEHARPPIRFTFSRLDDDVLITEQECAEICGFAAITLKQWRLKSKGHGPASIRLNKDIRYQVKAVRAWLAARSEAA
jgi:hypothetical protein